MLITQLVDIRLGLIYTICMEQEKQKDKAIRVAPEVYEAIKFLAFKKEMKIKKLIEFLLKEYINNKK